MLWRLVSRLRIAVTFCRVLISAIRRQWDAGNINVPVRRLAVADEELRRDAGRQLRYAALALLLILAASPIAARAATDEESCRSDTDHKVAVPACTRLIERKGVTRGQKATWLNWRGQSQFALEAFNPALADFNASLSFNPSLTSSRYWRGVTYFYLDKHNDAAADFDRVLEAEPENSQAVYWRGR